MKVSEQFELVRRELRKLSSDELHLVLIDIALLLRNQPPAPAIEKYTDPDYGIIPPEVIARW